MSNDFVIENRAQTQDDIPADEDLDAKAADDNKKKKKKIANSQERWENLLRGLMSAPEGREFIWMLLAKFPMQRTPFSPNSMTMAFAAGQQAKGFELTEEIQRLVPGNYINMLKERLE